MLKPSYSPNHFLCRRFDILRFDVFFARVFRRESLASRPQPPEACICHYLYSLIIFISESLTRTLFAIILLRFYILRDTGNILVSARGELALVLI